MQSRATGCFTAGPSFEPVRAYGERVDAERTWSVPNADTPYSYLWLNLRAEPVCLTLPEIKQDRYYTVQLIDLHISRFTYLGTPTTGNDHHVLPEWSGDKPDGIEDLVGATDIVLPVSDPTLPAGRSQERSRNPEESSNSSRSSAFLGTAPPPVAPPIECGEPTSRR